MDDVENIYSFLLFTGYLKITNIDDRDAFSNQYHLVIPNKEVKTIFEKQFDKYFKEYTEQSKNELSEAFQLGDAINANQILNKILFASISFYDYDEKFYHGLLFGLLNSASPLSNQESGLGRYDVAVLSANIFETSYILELKASKSMAETKTDCLKALKQIEEKQCVEGLKQQGYENVLAYAIAFYKKGCYIMKFRNDK